MARETFEEFDVDKSGTLSQNEVYPMILSLYLKMAVYTKISADTVPTRAHVQEMMRLSDDNGDGQLSPKEFEKFAQFAAQGIVTRISVQMIVQIVICPFLAIHLAEYFLSLDLTLVVKLMKIGFIDVEEHMKMLLTIVINMVLLPLMMNSVGNLFIYYLCGERERRTSKKLS